MTRKTILLEEGISVEVSPGLFLESVDIKDLREQDINAHIMPAHIFNRLKENIRRDKRMESVPLCVQTAEDAPIEIVSGHHRVRAALAAGLSHAVVLVDRTGLTRSQIAAKQIAHNALVGSDDPETLERLLALVTTVDDLLETGLGEDYLPTPESFEGKLFTPHADYRWKTCTFTFLSHQTDKVRELAEATKRERPDIVIAGMEDQFGAFMKAVADFAREKKIISAGVAIAVLTEMAQAEVERLTAIREAKEKKEAKEGREADG